MPDNVFADTDGNVFKDTADNEWQAIFSLRAKANKSISVNSSSRGMMMSTTKKEVSIIST